MAKRALVKRGTTSKLATRDAFMVHLQKAKKELVLAVLVPQVVALYSFATTAERYARAHNLSEESLGFAHQLKIETLGRLGELMEQEPKATGARGQLAGRESSGGAKMTHQKPAIKTLEEQGITKSVAKLARKLAALRPTELTAVAVRDKTLAAVQRQKTATTRAKRQVLPDAKYRVIYADTPGSDDSHDCFPPTRMPGCGI